MAGIMDEYDPPTPVGKMYCAVLSAEEYEDQASKCTEQALAELIQYLGKNPVSYRRVMERRKKQEEENAGLFSYAKVLYGVHYWVWCGLVSELLCLALDIMSLPI